MNLFSVKKTSHIWQAGQERGQCEEVLLDFHAVVLVLIYSFSIALYSLESSCKPSLLSHFVFHDFKMFSYKLTCLFFVYMCGSECTYIHHVHTRTYRSQKRCQSGVVVDHTLIPVIGRQSQAGLWVWHQSGIQSLFQDSQRCYIEKLCLKQPKMIKKRPQMPQNSDWKLWTATLVLFNWT